MGIFPSVVSCISISISISVPLLSRIICLVSGFRTLGDTYITMRPISCFKVSEIHIAGQGTQEVHLAVDAEVVAMFLVLVVAGICRTLRDLLVERYLANTVDGVVGVVNSLGHTVLGTLYHHTATKDATEVGTLDGVHNTACIARTNTVLHPIRTVVRNPITVRHFCYVWVAIRVQNRYAMTLVVNRDKQQLQFISRDGRCAPVRCFRFIPRFIFILAFPDTLVPQLIVCLFARRKSVILINRNLRVNGIEVGTVVGDVQATITIHEGQVAIAIETTGMTRTYGDKVTVIDIVDGGSCITVHEFGIGTHASTRRSIATGKHGIVNNDTTLCEESFPTNRLRRNGIQFSPFTRPCVTLLLCQRVQISCRHIIACIISNIKSKSCRGLACCLIDFV